MNALLGWKEGGGGEDNLYIAKSPYVTFQVMTHLPTRKEVIKMNRQSHETDSL